MKTTTTKQKNFTMISDKLCRVPIKKISQTEKLYIAYILRYQANGNTLFASNKSIGEQLGIDGGSVKKLNNKMNKQFNFFSATQDKKFDNGTEYSSSHTIKVDEKLLDEFLDNVSTFIKEKPSTQNKAKEAPIPTQVIPEVQVEVIVSQNEDNEEIDWVNENINELKNRLSEEYPMKTDIERSVISIFKKANKNESDEITKYLYRNSKNINVDEYVENKINELNQKELA